MRENLRSFVHYESFDGQYNVHLVKYRIRQHGYCAKYHSGASQYAFYIGSCTVKDNFPELVGPDDVLLKFLV